MTNSRDPNEKAGPDGFGAQRFIEGDEPLPYVVRFENVASATAPAQVVRITDQLDPTEVELSTVSLGPVHFGDVFAGPPPGLGTGRPTSTCARSRTWSSASRATWTRRSAHLGVHLARSRDARADHRPHGGLPAANDDPPEGEGAVYFSAEPAGSLPSGDVIDNAASIVFDTNASIVTNTWLNAIDDDVPTSRVTR